MSKKPVKSLDSHMARNGARLTQLLKKTVDQDKAHPSEVEPLHRKKVRQYTLVPHASRLIIPVEEAK